jgi:MFS superfamily sulfate permease-like transporter
VVQILAGLLRAGVLSEFFPTSAVHGMLAAIGAIIIGKQVHIALGVSPVAKTPLGQYAEIPHTFTHANPEVALIGCLSLLLLFGLPLIKNRYVRLIPAPMLVLLLALPLGRYFDLSHEHVYTLAGQTHALGPKFLVDVPMNLLRALTFPDFSGLLTRTGWLWVVMFAVIGSLESVLSAKAIDLLDPWRRKTNMNRDLLAVGVGNTLSAFIGGLPMISEIVRSKANIDNGARTRFANLYHGLFLLCFVALVPALIHQIPLAALAAMLIYTGYRLASPREWIHAYRVGPEQLIVFISTLLGVLATDLLIGIAIGIGVEVVIHLLNGAPIGGLFSSSVIVVHQGDDTVIRVGRSAIFSNWISLKAKIDRVLSPRVAIDFSETRLVDHTVMEKLDEMQREFREQGRTLHLEGLDRHQSLSKHPTAARKKRLSLIETGIPGATVDPASAPAHPNNCGTSAEIAVPHA